MSIAPLADPSQAAAGDGPLAYWPLNEADSSMMIDVTPNEHNGVYSVEGVRHDVTDVLWSPPDRAADFDGVSGSASAMLDLSGTSTASVEFWLNWSSYADDDRLAMEYGTPYWGNSGFLVDPDGATWPGEFEVSLSDNVGGYSTVLFARPTAGSWHHYVFVFDRTAGPDSITPYVDGVPVPYSKPPGLSMQPAQGAENFGSDRLFLMSRGGNSLFGAGKLAQVSMYARALSATEVAAHLAAAGGTARTCSWRLQSVVDAAPVGSLVNVPACVYREAVTISKPLTLSAQPGAEIRGSDVWTEWTRAGSYWQQGPLPVFSSHGVCAPGTQSCLWAEQVYFDGLPLQHVAGSPTTGQFALDASRNVLLADNPSGHSVEVTTRTQWIIPQADNVTIQGWTMRHAANDAQSGALSPGSHSGWIIQNNILSDAHGAVVDIFLAPDAQLLRNEIARGGQLGVHGGAGLMQGNTIHDNNTAGFDGVNWEAGGVKGAAVVGATWDTNEVYNNQGPGLWCDVHCQNVTITNNRLHNNAEPGILWEVSSGAKITGNAVWENGWASPGWGFGGGIVLSSSGNNEVANNVVAWNADGISVFSQRRGDAIPVTGNNVHANKVIMSITDNSLHGTALGWRQDWAGNMFDASSNNQGLNNAFWFPSPEPSSARFAWIQDKAKLADFSATHGGGGSSYLSDCERDQALKSADIPGRPLRNPDAVTPARSC